MGARRWARSAIGSPSLVPLITLRDHGVTPDYVRGMRDSGYASLTMEELVNARDHGVTPERP